MCDDVQNLELAGFRADGSSKAESLLRLQDTQAVFITGSRVVQPIKTFLRVECAGSQRILLKANDLDLAGETLSAADKVAAGAVKNDAGPGAKGTR